MKTKELEINSIFTYIHILINSQKGFLKQMQPSLYILLIFTKSGESTVDSKMEIKINLIQLKLDENKEITRSTTNVNTVLRLRTGQPQFLY